MKKRLIPILLLALILTVTSVLPVMSASALVGPQYVYTSNGKTLNMRQSPSKNAPIIGHIPYGAMVDSYEYYNSSWGYVTYKGLSGYCMSRYFVSSPPGPKPQPQPTTKPTPASTGINYKKFVRTDYYAIVRPSTPSGYVNLRWAPSKSVSIENTYYAGYQLHVIAQDGTWAQVLDEQNNISGFMMLQFLSVADGSVMN